MYLLIFKCVHRGSSTVLFIESLNWKFTLRQTNVAAKNSSVLPHHFKRNYIASDGVPKRCESSFYLHTRVLEHPLKEGLVLGRFSRILDIGTEFDDVAS